MPIFENDKKENTSLATVEPTPSFFFKFLLNLNLFLVCNTPANANNTPDFDSSWCYKIFGSQLENKKKLCGFRLGSGHSGTKLLFPVL